MLRQSRPRRGLRITRRRSNRGRVSNRRFLSSTTTSQSNKHLCAILEASLARQPQLMVHSTSPASQNVRRKLFGMLNHNHRSDNESQARENKGVDCLPLDAIINTLAQITDRLNGSNNDDQSGCK
mmetsp:Transcript_38121/g.91235  ORF Transcript_38121/g.91235 Transcript_38121/m.91235 type:complete len:125 (-) Transcript_38121:784-1158(-)